MKCLSVCQPFAELIVQGKKTIELRKWNTKFRGEFLIHAAKKQQLTVVMWDVNAADYKQPDGTLPSPQHIHARVMRRIKPGSIVLMHNSKATVAALPGIIDAIRAKGYGIGLLQW